MDYRKELDALMAETAAMGARLTGRVPELTTLTTPVVQWAIDPVVSKLENEPAALIPRPQDLGPPEQEQIKKRVENFRAHQERVRLEREDYYSRTMQRAFDMASGRSDDRATE